MNSSDAVSETTDAEGSSEIPSAVTSVMETLSPSAARGFDSSNFAAASGAISLYRAFKSFRKGDRKRGLLRAGVGLFWIGVVLAQRRRKKRAAGPDISEVADAGSDLEEAIEPGERETDHATGAEVVNTTDADIENSDTAPEVETSAEIDREAAEDVDQRDVVGTDEVEAVESGDDETAVGDPDAETADDEMTTETADDETSVPESQSEIETGSEGEASETGTENAESESAE